MRALTIALPDSIRSKVEELAQAEGVSVDQFLATAAAEKVAAMLSVKYLEQEAANSNRRDFEKVLKAVPNVPPEPHDRLPD